MSVLLTKTGESFFVILSCLKSTESVGFFILEYLYEKFLSLIRMVPVHTVPKDFLLKSADLKYICFQRDLDGVQHD
jgi:hypothetical protein